MNTHAGSLLIDTSSDILILALFSKEGALLSSQLLPHNNDLSQSLLPSIQSLMEERGYSPKSLQSIALGVGPGSYTGTRVGASVAKSMGFALEIPVIGFPSPLLMIPPSIEGSFSFAIETKQKKFFFLQGSILQGKITELLPFSFIAADELLFYVKNTQLISPSRIDPSFQAILPSINLAPLISLLTADDPLLQSYDQLIYLCPI